ncbi:hypothetical protein [Rhizobium leguminosarum]
MADEILPLPPLNMSIAAHVEREWGQILASWKKGWASETRLSDLERYIEVYREKIFEKRELAPDYNWALDWLRAKAIHDANIDFVNNRRAHIDDVKKMWSDWCANTEKGMLSLSIEVLKSMVLLNGAAILASLAVLSGQISSPTHGAMIAAKCTILFSVVSLIMLAIGHGVMFLRAVEVQAKVRGALLGNTNHSKLYAIGRYLGRHLNPIIDVGNALIFGSVGVFALGSFIGAIVLIAA